MKKVSIIVPVYHVELYIEKCIDSLLTQTYSNIEYIFIDDCGTDNSVAIAKQIIAKYQKTDQVKWITMEKNQGPSVARNVGVEQAVGEYIFFVDSDDYITPDCIETHMAYMEKYKCDMVVGGALQDRLYEGEEVYLGCVYDAWGKTPWNKLVKKEFLQNHQITFKPGIIFEDFLWNLYIGLDAKSIYSFKRKTYFYCIHEDSCSHKVTKFRFDSFAKVVNEIALILQDRGLANQKESIRFFELYKLRGMDTFVTDYSQWKEYRSILKIKLVPTWKLLLGCYSSKVQKRAVLSVMPYFLYKPLAKLYWYLAKKS